MVSFGSGGDDPGFGEALDQQGVAFEDSPELLAGRLGNLIFGAARKQAAGEAGNRCIAGRMGRGDARLTADARGEPAGDQRDNQQDDDGDDVRYAVHAQRVHRFGEEEMVGKRSRHARCDRRAETP